MHLYVCLCACVCVSVRVFVISLLFSGRSHRACSLSFKALFQVMFVARLYAFLLWRNRHTQQSIFCFCMLTMHYFLQNSLFTHKKISKLFPTDCVILCFYASEMGPYEKLERHGVETEVNSEQSRKESVMKPWVLEILSLLGAVQTPLFMSAFPEGSTAIRPSSLVVCHIAGLYASESWDCIRISTCSTVWARVPSTLVLL